MRLLVLALTLLFSFSVLADCCNSEVEISTEQCQVVESAIEDCHAEADHSTEADHCHCSPTSYFKILSSERITLTLPSLLNTLEIPSLHLPLESLFENSIFHPPIA